MQYTSPSGGGKIKEARPDRSNASMLKRQRVEITILTAAGVAELDGETVGADVALGRRRGGVIAVKPVTRGPCGRVKVDLGGEFMRQIRHLSTKP